MPAYTTVTFQLKCPCPCPCSWYICWLVVEDQSSTAIAWWPKASVCRCVFFLVVLFGGKKRVEPLIYRCILKIIGTWPWCWLLDAQLFEVYGQWHHLKSISWFNSWSPGRHHLPSMSPFWLTSSLFPATSYDPSLDHVCFSRLALSMMMPFSMDSWSLGKEHTTHCLVWAKNSSCNRRAKTEFLPGHRGLA